MFTTKKHGTKMEEARPAAIYIFVTSYSIARTPGPVT